MSNPKITLEEALKLVEFRKDCHGKWYVGVVKGNCNLVKGRVITVKGDVVGTINGRRWQYVETPKERFERLIGETKNKELIEAFKQLEDSND